MIGRVNPPSQTNITVGQGENGENSTPSPRKDQTSTS